jgi:hypothetical protein
MTHILLILLGSGSDDERDPLVGALREDVPRRLKFGRAQNRRIENRAQGPRRLAPRLDAQPIKLRPDARRPPRKGAKCCLCPLQNPSKVYLALPPMRRTVRRMGDDIGIPVPDELAIKIEFFCTVWHWTVGKQGRAQTGRSLCRHRGVSAGVTPKGVGGEETAKGAALAWGNFLYCPPIGNGCRDRGLAGAKAPRAHAEDLAKALIEGREIAETGVKRDGRNRRGRRSQFHSSSPKPQSEQELMRRHTNEPAETSKKMKLAHARDRRKLVERQRLLTVLHNVMQCAEESPPFSGQRP